MHNTSLKLFLSYLLTFSTVLFSFKTSCFEMFIQNIIITDSLLLLFLLKDS